MDDGAWFLILFLGISVSSFWPLFSSESAFLDKTGSQWVVHILSPESSSSVKVGRNDFGLRIRRETEWANSGSFFGITVANLTTSQLVVFMGGRGRDYRPLLSSNY